MHLIDCKAYNKGKSQIELARIWTTVSWRETDFVKLIILYYLYV